MSKSKIGIKVSCSKEKYLSRFNISKSDLHVGDGSLSDNLLKDRNKSEGHNPNKVSSKEIEEELVWKDINDVDALGIALRYVGHMGRYQRLLILGMLPFGVFFAYLHYTEMFVIVKPRNYWCKVPELAALDKETRHNLIAPKKRTVVHGTVTYSRNRCATFDTNWTDVLKTMIPPASSTPLKSCQNGWEYEFSDIPYETVVTQRGWVCENSVYAPTAQGFYFLGSGAGGLLLGYLADKYGRVPSLVGANLFGCIGGIAIIFTNGFWDFVACLFLIGMAYDNAFTLMYILVLEYVGPRHRTWVAPTSTGVFIGVGCLSLPWLALWVGDWKNLILVTSLPLLLVVLVPFLVPESVRWLVKRGRVEDAVKILRKFERVNRRKIPPAVLNDFLMGSKISCIWTFDYCWCIDTSSHVFS